MTPFKIAIIGAGSVGFTKKLCSDILKVPEFAGIEIALTDINAHNLDMIAQIIRRIVDVNGLPAKVTATTDRRAALTGARYVMNCVRIGGLEAFAVPTRYEGEGGANVEGLPEGFADEAQAPAEDDQGATP